MDVVQNLKEFNDALNTVESDITLPSDVPDDASVCVMCDKPDSHHCDLTWTIIVDGKDVSDIIPTNIRHDSMNTENEYSVRKDDSYDEYEYYNAGLDEEHWIAENKDWLSQITDNETIQKKIFQEIQKHEFTGCGECRGCE